MSFVRGFARAAPRLAACLAVTLALAGAVRPAAASELAALMAEALEGHPAAQVQRERADAAHADEDAARWQFWPTPHASVDGAWAGNSVLYRGDRAATAIGLTQPLWTGGRLTARLQRSQAGSAAAQASQQLAQLQLALRVAQGYGDWWAARLKLDALDKALAEHERLLALVTRRVEQGQSARADQLLAQERLASLRADLGGAQVQQRVALGRLSQLVGRALDGAALAAPAQPPLSVDASLGAVLQRVQAASPLLALYRAQADAEAATVAERKAERWPELRLRAERLHGNLSSPGVGGSSVVALSLSSSFGAGLSQQSAIAAATSRQAAALAEADAQWRELAEQVTADHALLLQSADRREALRAAAELSEQVRQAWDRQFLAGRKSWQDLMNAARDQVQTEIQWADFDAAQRVASWRLGLLADGLPATLDRLTSAASFP
ncbi:TolC family protein [Azohydromonas lata]|uniref:TolC family protein n=1 Tax=Azohydromonas lata TaxID=45677 RepID=UPI000834EB23|nr:TolC family protein [Azohydromonas lata]